jgi:uncharacterized membrane protein
MSRRLNSLDLIRGIAILAMVQAHIWEFYIGKPVGIGVYLLKWFFSPLGGYAAPLFTLVSGMSAHLSVQSVLLNAECQSALGRHFLRKGIALFLLSTLVNFLAGPLLHVLDISMLNWGILQLIGACLCLVPVFVRLNGTIKIAWVMDSSHHTINDSIIYRFCASDSLGQPVLWRNAGRECLHSNLLIF